MFKLVSALLLHVLVANCVAADTKPYTNAWDSFLTIQKAMLDGGKEAALRGNGASVSATAVRPQSAATANKWAVTQIFSGSTCGNNPISAMSIGLGQCYPLIGSGGSALGSANSTAVTFTQFTDGACSVPSGTQQASDGTTANIVISSQSAPPSTYSSPGQVATFYDSVADCTAGSGVIYGWSYTSNCAAGTAATCSGNQVTVTLYKSNSCTGTGSPTTGAANSHCADSNLNSMLGAVGYGPYLTCYTPAATTTTSSSSSSCFAGSEAVVLASGESVSIADVRVGDKVLACDLAAQRTVFSDVIAVPHARNNHAAEFQQITLETGRDIKMTSEHLLPAGQCSLSSLPLTRAADVLVGDCVQTTEGPVRVLSNQIVSSMDGVYTIVTEAEYVVVNGIVASPFAVNHAVANFMYGFHRVIYSLAPKLVAPVSAIMTNLAAYFTK